MATEEWQTYCPRCRAVVLVRRDIPNHLLHFIITFFTCRLWIIPWIIIGVEAPYRPFRCPTCGTAGTNAPVRKAPVTPPTLDQQPLSRPKNRPVLAIIIGLLCLVGLTYLVSPYVGTQVQTESTSNPTVAGRPSAPPTVRTSAESATPEMI